MVSVFSRTTFATSLRLFLTVLSRVLATKSSHPPACGVPLVMVVEIATPSVAITSPKPPYSPSAFPRRQLTFTGKLVNYFEAENETIGGEKKITGNSLALVTLTK